MSGRDEFQPESDSDGTSRRNVLKAGVAVGVGAVAWSGPTITSLGGTPAYAAVCTQPATIEIDITSDTNTNASCTVNGFTYLTFQDNLKVGDKPAWLDLTNFSGHCASTPGSVTWVAPEGLKCQLQIRIYNNNAINLTGTLAPNPPSTTWISKQTVSPAVIPTVSKLQPNPDPNANLIVSANGRYGVALVCVPIDAQCYPDGIDF